MNKTIIIKMKFFMTLFLSLASATIKNNQNPVCQNCNNYRPNLFSPSLSKCSQFGNKNVITGHITYDYADLSRMNSEKCGLEGKYYNEISIPMKALQIAFIHNLPNSVVMFIIFLSIWLNK
jgi:hypothetical protein